VIDDRDPAAGLGRRAVLRSAALAIMGVRFLSAPTLSLLTGCGDDRRGLPPPDEAQRYAAGVARAYFEPDPTGLATTLGLAYLAELSPDSDTDAIAADLADLVALIANAGGEGEARAAVEDAVVRDFRERATMTLSGWSLGRTELRLSALVALSGE